MPDPQVDQIAPGGIVQLNDAPAGFDDATFDALFPADGVGAVAAAPQVQQNGTPAAQVSQTQTPATQTQTPVAPPQVEDVFIKGEKSVYKTREATIEGLNHKDQMIDTLRQRYALATGVDPITGQPLTVQTAQPLVQEVNYATNPKQYMDDLYKAGQTSPEALASVQKKFILDSIGPNVVNAGNEMARNRAINSVSAEIKDFNSFIGTETYNKALDVVPELKNAIATAESDSQFSGQLPGLYKAAYLIGKGLQVPQIVAAATQQSNSQTSRPSVTPTLTPRTATITPSTNAKANFKSIDGIRAIIAEQEAKGTKLDF